MLVVMVLGDIAGVDLEDLQVEMLHECRLTLTVGAVLN